MVAVLEVADLVTYDEGELILAVGLFQKSPTDDDPAARERERVGVVVAQDGGSKRVRIVRPVGGHPVDQGLEPLLVGIARLDRVFVGLAEAAEQLHLESGRQQRREPIDARAHSDDEEDHGADHATEQQAGFLQRVSSRDVDRVVGKARVEAHAGLFRSLRPVP